MPDESDVVGAAELPVQGPGGRKVRVWAICHVGGVTPAVKIFDTGSGSNRDIRGGDSRGISLASSVCAITGGCK